MMCSSSALTCDPSRNIPADPGPIEVGGGDATGVGENVWDDEDALVLENVIGGSRGGAIGAFDDDSGLDPAAFWVVITFSVAAGMSTSQSEIMSSWDRRARRRGIPGWCRWRPCTRRAA